MSSDDDDDDDDPIYSASDDTDDDDDDNTRPSASPASLPRSSQLRQGLQIIHGIASAADSEASKEASLQQDLEAAEAEAVAELESERAAGRKKPEGAPLRASSPPPPPPVKTSPRAESTSSAFHVPIGSPLSSTAAWSPPRVLKGTEAIKYIQKEIGVQQTLLDAQRASPTPGRSSSRRPTTARGGVRRDSSGTPATRFGGGGGAGAAGSAGAGAVTGAGAGAGGSAAGGALPFHTRGSTWTNVVPSPAIGAPSPRSSLLRVRRHYEDRLEKERATIRRKEAELDVVAQRVENEAHRQAVATTTKSLTRLRHEQQQQLQQQHKIHQAQEHDKAAAAVREAQLLEAHRAELSKVQREVRVAAEARGTAQLKAAEERHAKALRQLEEKLRASAAKRLEDAFASTKREAERADRLQRELDAIKADAHMGLARAERSRRELEEAVREAEAKCHVDKVQAVQTERRYWKQVRENALQAESIRSETVLQKTRIADENATQAAQALQLAHEAQQRAEVKWRIAESEREAMAEAQANLEALRRLAQEEFDRGQMMAADAEARVAAMKAEADEQRKQAREVQRLATEEKEALLRAIEEARDEALRALEKKAAGETHATEAAKAVAELQHQHQPSAVGSSTKPNEGPARIPDGLTSAAGGASPPASRPPAPPSHRPSGASPPASRPPAPPSHRLSWEAAQAERQLERLQTSLEDSELQISKLDSRLKQALYDKAAALERLRKAYATRIEAKPLDAAAVVRASSIAGAAVLPARMHAKEDCLVSMYMPLGVVCATPLSHSLAETAGFGCDGRDLEVLVVQQHGLAGRPMALAGRTAAEDGAIASAVAVRQGRGAGLGLGLGIPIHTRIGLSPGIRTGSSMLEHLEDTWLLKIVFDPPNNGALDADVEPTATYLGPRHVTISTKDGIVVVRGEVHLTPRAPDESPSKRYDYHAATSAATLMQAFQRGHVGRQRYVQLGGTRAKGGRTKKKPISRASSRP
jgi:hypothetical protein